mmetsp:Transcript_18185/g.21002  ORF Transcript_18185/g.21002 Transcript_18185/m.21002 type:complete len:454 (+) Transcript_18185:87-1448(+)|eukprot:CAMPEP_0194183738 /NCGR_PEP_ID=MMETSP0154-20130528/33515_1 /TAXON_ID=1049557 /ORGANISM="Thalassiothrix antarctica, Strain L6-D1" /LENGTH=453 /DNA_ID=CAMNT_0038900889 /DNA_START=68 /DNA_END=1429 /DNA_ORIENTATION=-
MVLTRKLSNVIALYLLSSVSHIALGFQLEINKYERRSEISNLLATPVTSSETLTFTYSPKTLDHLKNIELKDDYSRSWSTEKTKCFAAGLLSSIVFGYSGELVTASLFDVEDVEKAGLLFASVGMAAGWILTGGNKLTKDEQVLNGGYDAKLVADRPARLRTILEYLRQTTMPVQEISSCRDESGLLKVIEKVHDKSYIDMLQQRSLASDQPNRLNPVSPTTLIDEHSYPAALAAVEVWLDAVDAALLQNHKPKFGLVRPPSHHACRSKGMGGCLFNSVVIAAEYALSKGINSVAILDIDAHHGNGIAHCIQDNPKIKFVSMHEATSKLYLAQPKSSPENPRTSAVEDVGPLGNILNVNLEPKSNWQQYEQNLRESALPFLQDADILLVAAGLDTMQLDWSSSFQLTTGDYKKLGRLIKECFGDRVAFGLEGGYAYQNQELAKSIEALADAWV